MQIDELKAAVRQTLKLNPQDLPEADIEALFHMLDADGSETIEIEEFLVFLEHGPAALLAKAAGGGDGDSAKAALKLGEAMRDAILDGDVGE